MAFQASSIRLWREENRAPTFPGRMNRWIVATNQGNSSADVGRNIEAALKRNAGRNVVRSFRVVQAATSSDQLDDDTEVLAGVGGLPVGPKPQLPDGSVVALVEFAWDSPRESVAWLSETVTRALLPRDTFRSPDTLLLAVLEPGGQAPAPEPGLLDSIDDIAERIDDIAAPAIGIGTVAVAIWVLASGED